MPRDHRDRPARVAVTGLGVVSALGCEVDGFWRRLTAGEVATAPVTRFATDRFPTRNAAEVDPAGLSPEDGDEDEVAATRPRAVRYARHAARRAVAGAGPGLVDRPERAGLVLGTVMGTRPHLEELCRRGRQLPTEPSWDSPGLLVDVPAAELGLHGPRLVVGAGCAAGNTALALAADLVADGAADVVLAGGVDELSGAVFQLFTTLRALAADRVRPFDRDRGGMMPGEGAGVLVLESAEHAARRGARPLAELSGWAVAADAHHMTAPQPDGRAVRRCMEGALGQAGLAPGEVDHVSAHGTGTRASDALEASCLARFFGAHRARPAVSSLKGQLGHAQGGASALEAVACVLAIRNGLVPGNPTLREPDELCAGLDLVRGAARRQPVDTALSNAFGFGGNSASVLFRAHRELP